MGTVYEGGVLLAILVGVWFVITAKGRREDFANRQLKQARNLADAKQVVDVVIPRL